MRNRLLLLTTISILALGCASGTPNLETYRGQAIVMGAIGAGANSTVQMSISRWTTAEERQALFAALESGGSEALAKALFNSEETGFVSIAGRRSYRMRYAWAVEKEGTRTIVMATDRPIGFGEATEPGARTRDYDISIIVLNLDADGNGSGSFAVGTQVMFDKEKNQLVLEYYSTEPVRLNSISRIE